MTHSLSPTVVLPTLATLYACDAARIDEALQALRDVYFPHTASLTTKQSLSDVVPALRPRCLIHHDGVPDSGYASAEEDDPIEYSMTDEALDSIRLDEYERGYAITWLTGFVKRGDGWMNGTGSFSLEEQDARTRRIEDASRLLALFAGGDVPEEALTRMFVFPLCMPLCHRCAHPSLPSPTPPITVRLNDAPVDGTDHTAVGLQSWGSAIVFAQRLCLNPERFLGTLHPCGDTTSARRRRVLELGAGTGLLSITAAQIFSRTTVQAKIDATDYHPGVLENLGNNVRHNSAAAGVSVQKLDWCAPDWGEEGYDVILAADVVYHPEHAGWIRGCVERILGGDGVFWKIIPKRTIGRHEGLWETVETAFPVAVGDEGKSKRLAIAHREEMEKEGGVGRADEAGYTLFEIRWM